MASPLLVIPNHGYSLFRGGRVVREDTGTSLIYDPEQVQIIGMGSMFTDEIVSSSRLTTGINGGWKIAGGDVPGCLLDVSLDEAV